jgi:hypothetical protein
MDIETRKYLTEKVLGECWHKVKVIDDRDDLLNLCSK